MTIFGGGDGAKAELPNAHPTNNKAKINLFIFLLLLWFGAFRDFSSLRTHFWPFT